MLLAPMAVQWEEDEEEAVRGALRRFPVASGRCAALARVVFKEGSRRDPSTCGRHLRPRGAARFVLPIYEPTPRWGSHTFVETHEHAVDALTGVEGCPAEDYLVTHWRYHEVLVVTDVDPATVDPGIQDEA